MAPKTREEHDYDYLVKCVLIGDSGVGKSNLLTMFTRHEFLDSSKPTIGVEFATKNVEVGNKLLKCQLWDTAGQERYRAITSAYYRGAVAALVVYDITRASSLENVPKWLHELKDHADNDIIVALVGNKNDLEGQREVPTKAGKELAEREALLFFETSAKLSHMVEEAFQELLNQVHDVIARNELAATGDENLNTMPEAGRSIHITEAMPEVPQHKRSCCSS